ncbi:uncharacterized protein DSM5745_06909 [Aspergillus mulundensis]|uniref:FAD/NAD(P)-binding domain-containing protein n=1 Tax=Aspergillus mulundensis TaxID=1810919 RepID=A0A3D8RJM4_9EURO|nr:hypothetical protein DSM5745_06909 [Aspergillus mulundensis]RDW74247.1 hypothetical protein DSM5745_06909 [Aspergillus mulundensis]
MPHGIGMKDGSMIGLDALILATGFDVVTGSALRFNFHGIGNAQQRMGHPDPNVPGQGNARLSRFLLPVRPSKPGCIRERPLNLRDSGGVGHHNDAAHARAEAVNSRHKA